MRPLLWIPMAVLRLVTVALGLVMVPLMYATEARPFWLFRPWFNPTEGLGLPYAWKRNAEAGHFLQRKFPHFWFHAIRNPANGLRTYSWLTVALDYSRMDWRGNDLPTNPGPLRRTGRRIGWFYAWQGPYAGLWLCVLWNRNRHAKIRWGWKLVPLDTPFATEWRPDPAGFAASTLLWREG